MFAVGLSIVDVVRRSAQPHDAVLGWVERLGRYADVAGAPQRAAHAGGRRLPARRPAVLRQRHYVKARVQEALRGAPTRARWLVFDAEGVTHVDSAGLDALEELTAELRREDVTLLVARMKEHVRDRLDEAGPTEEIGAEHFHPTIRAAIESTLTPAP